MIAGPFIFASGFHLRKKYKLIEDIPTSKTRSVAMGLVEVIGTAESVDGTCLTSPFSCNPCLYYSYLVEEERGSGKNRHWVTIAEGASTRRFLLKDDTGVISVDPVGVELNLGVDDSLRDVRVICDGMVRLGLPDKRSAFGMTLRCSEKFVSPGDPIFVLGTAVNLEGTTVIAKGGLDDYFCLSDGSEKDILGKLKLGALLCLYGGPLLTVSCLYALFKFYLKIL